MENVAHHSTVYYFKGLNDIYLYYIRMSLKEFKRILYTYDKKTQVNLVDYFTTWMKNKANIATIQKRTIVKKTQPIKKQIPKLIRGKVWEAYHGQSMIGSCYCCKRDLNAFDAWHAGHIIPQAHGGSDTASNLRPVCASCNTSMGTQNMDAFKAQFYPESIV